MAIQIPNPGTGNGATGDNEFVLWSKVKDNFSNTTHAASRIIGSGEGQVPLVENVKNTNLSGLGITGAVPSNFNTHDTVGEWKGVTVGKLNTPLPDITSRTVANVKFSMLMNRSYSSGADSRMQEVIYLEAPHTGRSFYRVGENFPTVEFSDWIEYYTTKNTTKDTATGFLKASSPVLHVYNDSITKIHEAEQLDITVDKKGVGHYEIHGTTGLRQNDGWNMSPPRDLHGNVLCMIDVTEKDDVVILKTYKRKFDLELAAIVHDYDNPLDIPAGVCVEFRFNDLPYDVLNDIQTEV